VNRENVLNSNVFAIEKGMVPVERSEGKMGACGLLSYRRKKKITAFNGGSIFTGFHEKGSRTLNSDGKRWDCFS